MVVDADLERGVAGEGMGGAAEAGVVGAEGHLDLVEQALGDVAALDQALRGLLDAHGDAGGVVAGGHDHVGHRDQAALVGLVMMEQRAARGLDHAHALGGHGGRDAAHLRTGDLGIVDQLLDALGGLDHLDHARPVVGQRVVHGLAAQGLEELLVGGLRLGRGHAVGGVEAGQRRDRVDARVRTLRRSPSSRAASGR